jgi:hypothetical protein
MKQKGVNVAVDKKAFPYKLKKYAKEIHPGRGTSP